MKKLRGKTNVYIKKIKTFCVLSSSVHSINVQLFSPQPFFLIFRHRVATALSRFRGSFNVVTSVKLDLEF